VFCGGPVVVLLSGSGAFDTGSAVTIDAGPAELAHALDIDGDGFADIAFIRAQVPPRVAFNTSTAPGTFTAASSIGTTMSGSVNYGRYSAGSGSASGSAVDALVDTGTLFDQGPPRVFSMVSAVTLGLAIGTDFVNVAVDLNNDGRDDVYSPGFPSPSSFALQCPTRGTFFPTLTATFVDMLQFPIQQIVFVGDISGDGLPDLIGFDPQAGSDVFEVALHD
jgi:hypothetical protein